jgi:hypothetical protein
MHLLCWNNAVGRRSYHAVDSSERIRCRSKFDEVIAGLALPPIWQLHTGLYGSRSSG